MATAAVQSGQRATRPATDEYAPYYGTYVAKVGDGDVVATLRQQVRDTMAVVRGIPESGAGHRYAEGKWSIREVLGHLSDAERVFSYRALRFARGDATALPGFDENAFIAGARFDDRTLASIADEFDAVRASTAALFESLFPEEWTRRGTASGKEMSVRALAWVIAGHELHHRGVLLDRYLAGKGS